MHTHEPGKTSALVLTALLAGCAGNPAPKGWQPPAAEAQRSTRGGWILIECEDETNVTGELIAVDDMTLHVLTASGFQSVPRSSVRESRLVGYGTAENLRVWTAVGAVSTLSHGGGLILTLPMWLIGGGVAASDEVKAALVPLDEFAQFARFPQGLPPEFDPSLLGPLVQEAVPRDGKSPPQKDQR